MARLLVRGLSEEGHAVDLCERGSDALEQGAAIAYDVIVLDWALPDLDGLSVLRRWRQGGMATPVLMLTARGTSAERVTGLRAGADDYLAKPFDFEEFLARLEALHRRAGGGDRRRRLGSLILDLHRRRLIHGELEVALTPREFTLLEELAAHPGETRTRAALLDAVWGEGFDGTANVVDVYVGYLRSKLRKLVARDVAIHSVRGSGFRLDLGPGDAT